MLLKALNHVLKMNTGHTLRDFIPNKAVQRGLAEDIEGAQVPSLTDMPLLKFAPCLEVSSVCFSKCLASALSNFPLLDTLEVVDEEKSQNKALLFATQILKVAAVIDKDLCHSHWNIFKRSTAAAGLTLPLLKLTTCCI